MTDAKLTLYSDSFWISPYVFTCFVALREKGVPFDVVPVALNAGEQRAASFADKSITARVPALMHGDFSLAESGAIVEYVEEAFPKPRILPADRRDRARARQVMGWVRSDLGALRQERSTATMFYAQPTKPLSADGRTAADKLIAVATRLLPPGGTTLFGDWCIADSDLAFMLQRLVMNGDDVPAPLRAFADAQWKRPSVREYVEHARIPYVPY